MNSRSKSGGGIFTGLNTQNISVKKGKRATQISIQTGHSEDKGIQSMFNKSLIRSERRRKNRWF